MSESIRRQLDEDDGFPIDDAPAGKPNEQDASLNQDDNFPVDLLPASEPE